MNSPMQPNNNTQTHEGGILPEDLNLPAGTWTIRNLHGKIFVSGEDPNDVSLAAETMGLNLSSGDYGIGTVEVAEEDYELSAGHSWLFEDESDDEMS